MDLKTKSFCFEKSSHPDNCMCEGVGEDSGNGA